MMARKLTRPEKLEKIAELEEWIASMERKVGRRRSSHRSESLHVKIEEARAKIKALEA